MKCSIPEISWHNREPVLSVDLQPSNSNNEFYRLATSGSDTFVLIWKLKKTEDGQIAVTILSELTRHQRSVNVVKWSPNGVFLASGDDDANIILWQLKTDNIPSLDEHENDFEERWNVFKILRGHKEDVYDLCWSPKCDKMLSGSVDNTAILWDVSKGKIEHIITDHKGFVQGVAWDPKSDFLATLCSDRVCRVFERNGRRVRSRIGRGVLPVSESNDLYSKEVKYFHDDTFKTYFRRLSFTPDGSLLLVPSGAVETDEKKNILYGTFAFTMDSFNRPVCILPSGKQCSIAVKCSPILFQLREGGPKPIVDLPYRMIIAVATDSDVILYDTQQLAPCVHLQNIHYTRLTDLTWSPDGLLLAASSTDGFITLVTFDEGELGTPYILEEVEAELNLNISGCEELSRDEVVETLVEIEKEKVEKPKKPSFLEQWAKQAPKRKLDDQDGSTEKISKRVKSEREVKILEKAVEGSINEGNNVEMKELKSEENTVDVKKKRITPMLLSKETSKTDDPKVAKPNEVIPVSVQEIKPKKRIQPIKIGEAIKGISANKNTNKTEEIVLRNEEVHTGQNTQDSHKEMIIQPLKNDEEKMPAPLTPKNTTGPAKNIDVIEKNDTSTTPIDKCKHSPKEKSSTPNIPLGKSKSSSSKKKKTSTPSNNTLFKYLKPIPKTPNAEDKPKSEFKPQKLFDTTKTDSEDIEVKQSSQDINVSTTEFKIVLNKIDITKYLNKRETKECNDTEIIKSANKQSKNKKLTKTDTEPASEAVKIKTSNLFKHKSEIKMPESLKVSKDNDDTITDMPDDFVLQVAESPEHKIEKENELHVKDYDTDNKCKEEPECVDKPLNSVKQCDVTIQVETKQPRRIPLITLSSPKNKKKTPVE